MNSVNLIGRFCKKPEVTYSKNHTPMCRFTIAVDRGKDKEGNDRGADFLPVLVMGKSAESIAKYMDKGYQVGIHGQLESSNYENNKGEMVYAITVKANRIDFIQWPPKEDQQGYHEESAEERWERQHRQSAPAAPSQYERPPLPTEPPPYQYAMGEGIICDDEDLPF